MRRSKSERKSSKKNADENRSLTKFRLRPPPPSFRTVPFSKCGAKLLTTEMGEVEREGGGGVLHAKKVEEAIDRERGGRYVAHVRPTYVLLLLPLYMRYLLLLLLLPGSLSPWGRRRR